MIVVGSDLSGEFIKFIVKVSIAKSDFSKYLDLIRLANQLAISEKDEERKKIFTSELTGYATDEVPDYRIVRGVPIRLAAHDIIRNIEKRDDDMQGIFKIGDKFIRVRELKYILVKMENYMWSFIGDVLMDFDSSSRSSLLGSMGAEIMDSVPDEIKAMMKELSA